MDTTPLEIPYPPVFRNWHPATDTRVSTALGAGGVVVEVKPHGQNYWIQVELTETDAALLAASLLDRAGDIAPGRGFKKLSRRILKRLNR